jgi:hypothetical protein
MDNLLASLDTAQTHQHDLHLGRMSMPEPVARHCTLLRERLMTTVPLRFLPPRTAVETSSGSRSVEAFVQRCSPKKTCNYNNYGHDADDIENVHCVLRLRYARLSWLPPRARSSVDELKN